MAGSVREAARSHSLVIAHLAQPETRGSPQVRRKAAKEASQDIDLFLPSVEALCSRGRGSPIPPASADESGGAA
jgi:hypothetical protein